MRTIIAGSRDGTTFTDVIKACERCPWEITTIISGTARGTDRLGEKYAKELEIPLERYPADWDKHGKSAGYKRNELMASKAEALIAIWNGTSKGTQHMINIAKKAGLPTYIVEAKKR